MHIVFEEKSFVIHYHLYLPTNYYKSESILPCSYFPILYNHLYNRTLINNFCLAKIIEVEVLVIFFTYDNKVEFNLPLAFFKNITHLCVRAYEKGNLFYDSMFKLKLIKNSFQYCFISNQHMKVMKYPYKQ